MILLGECKRSILGSGSISQKLIKRKISELSGNGGFLYHTVIRRNGQCWLVSGTSEGVPIVESVISSQKLNKPFIVFHKTVTNVLLMAYVSGDRLDSIIETRINALTDVVAEKAINSINNENGIIFVIDDVINDVDLLNGSVALSSSHLLNNSKIILQTGDQHKAPMTFQQLFLICTGICIIVSLIFFIVTDENKKEIKKEAQNEFVQLENTLEKRGSAKAMSYQLYKDLLFIQHLIGWKATTIVMNEEFVFIEVEKEMIGRLDHLLELVSKTGRSISKFSENKATIISQYQPLPTLGEAVLVPIEDLQVYIGLAQDDWLSGEKTKLTFGKIKSKKAYSEMELQWDVNEYFKDDLDTMGTLLNMIPVVFNRASLTINQDKTFSGKFIFTIVGCEKTKCEEI
ncbi:MAG: hypothetical protein V7749_00705 [Cocleimonas sp.]